jgi:tape measure domain-containing protein
VTDVVINFREVGADDVIKASGTIAKNVTQLKALARTPIESSFVQNTVGAGFDKLKEQVMRARAEVQRLNQETGKIKPPSFSNLNAKGIDNSALTASNFTATAASAKAAGNEIQQMGNKTQKMGAQANAAGFQLGFISRLLAAMAIRKIVHDIVELTDVFTSFQNKLKVVVEGQNQLALATRDMVDIAIETRLPLEAVTTVFTRTSRAVANLGKSQLQTTKFTETLSKAIQVGGSTSVEASNALIQLSQGLGSGTLKGDELRSVLEQLPIVAQLIGDKLGVTISALRKLGSEGKLTTQVVFDAIAEASDKVNAKFALMKPTISQAFEVLKTKFLVAIGEASPLTTKLAEALGFLATHFDQAVAGATAFLGVMTAIMAINAGAAAIAALANPWVALAAAVALAVTALATFHGEMKESEKSVDAFGAMRAHLATIKQDLGDVVKLVENTFKGFTGIGIELTFSWDQFYTRLAKVQDMLRMMVSPEQLVGALLGDKGAQKYATRTQDALARERALAQGKLADTNAQKMIDTETKFNMWLKDQQKAGKGGTAADANKKKGKKESGSTFSELLEDAELDALRASVNDLDAKVFEKLEKALDKLEPSILSILKEADQKVSAIQKEFNSEYVKNNAWEGNPEMRAKEEAAMQKKIAGVRALSAEYADQYKLLEEQYRIEVGRDYWKKENARVEKEHEEAMQKSVDDRLKAMLEEEELLRKMNDARSDKYMKKVDGWESTAQGLDPGLATNQKIFELEQFKKITPQLKDGALYANLANKEIERLNYTLTAGGRAFLTFGDQMTNIFGPGGTLSQGLADTIVKADNLKQGLRNLLDTIADQTLSALIQMPINAALGGIGSSLMPSQGGARQLAFRDTPFASGGYTGNYGTSEPAGIVHGQEYVVNAEATRKYRPMLEAINGGQSVGNKSAPPVNVSVHNYAGVQVETSQVSPGEIQVMINKAIQEKTPGLMASQISNPNSPASRALSRNLDASRKRL